MLDLAQEKTKKAILDMGRKRLHRACFLEVIDVAMIAFLRSIVLVSSLMASLVHAEPLHPVVSFTSDLGINTVHEAVMPRVRHSNHMEIENFDQSTLYNGLYADNFASHFYPFSSYDMFEGLDYTSLFATSVAFGDGFALVGASGHNIFEGMFSVYIPTSPSRWEWVADVTSPALDYSNFGMYIEIDGDNVLVAANGFNYYQGLVYLFQKNSLADFQLKHTFSSPLGVGQGFGSSIAISGRHIAIGTSVRNVFLYYQLTNGTWIKTDELANPTGEYQSTKFGSAVALNGDYLAVGANEQDLTYGAVFLYRYVNNTEWIFMTMLSSPGGEKSYFGYAVAMTNGTLAVGSPGWREDLYHGPATQPVNNTGTVYLYDLYNYTVLTTYSENVSVVEQNSSYNNATSSNATATYTVLQTQNYTVESEHLSWNLTDTIASPVGNNSLFGHSVKIKGDNLVIGAMGFPYGSGQGAAFYYSRQVLYKDEIVNVTRYLQSVEAVNVTTNSTSNGNETTAAMTSYNVTSVAYKTPWTLNISFASPAGYQGNFGWGVAVTDNYAAMGADGYNDIQGSIYFASLIPMATKTPTASPTFAPSTMEPTSIPTSRPTTVPTVKPTSIAAAQSISGLPTLAEQTSARVTMIAVIVGACLLMTIGLCCLIFCCCIVPPPPMLKKKKKKDEEEDGPFTVHGPFSEKLEMMGDYYGEGEYIQPMGYYNYEQQYGYDYNQQYDYNYDTNYDYSQQQQYYEGYEGYEGQYDEYYQQQQLQYQQDGYYQQEGYYPEGYYPEGYCPEQPPEDYQEGEYYQEGEVDPAYLKEQQQYQYEQQYQYDQQQGHEYSISEDSGSSDISNNNKPRVKGQYVSYDDQEDFGMSMKKRSTKAESTSFYGETMDDPEYTLQPTAKQSSMQDVNNDISRKSSSSSSGGNKSLVELAKQRALLAKQKVETMQQAQQSQSLQYQDAVSVSSSSSSEQSSRVIITATKSPRNQPHQSSEFTAKLSQAKEYAKGVQQRFSMYKTKSMRGQELVFGELDEVQQRRLTNANEIAIEEQKRSLLLTRIQSNLSEYDEDEEEIVEVRTIARKTSTFASPRGMTTSMFGGGMNSNSSGSTPRNAVEGGGGGNKGLLKLGSFMQRKEEQQAQSQHIDFNDFNDIEKNSDNSSTDNNKVKESKEEVTMTRKVSFFDLQHEDSDSTSSKQSTHKKTDVDTEATPAAAPAVVAVSTAEERRSAFKQKMEAQKLKQQSLVRQASFMPTKHNVHQLQDLNMPELAEERVLTRQPSMFPSSNTASATTVHTTTIVKEDASTVTETAEEVAQRKLLLAQQEAQLKEANKTLFEQQRREAEEKRIKDREALRMRAMERAKSRFAMKDPTAAAGKGLTSQKSTFSLADTVLKSMAAAKDVLQTAGDDMSVNSGVSGASSSLTRKPSSIVTKNVVNNTTTETKIVRKISSFADAKQEEEIVHNETVVTTSSTIANTTAVVKEESEADDFQRRLLKASAGARHTVQTAFAVPRPKKTFEMKLPELIEEKEISTSVTRADSVTQAIFESASVTQAKAEETTITQAEVDVSEQSVTEKKRVFEAKAKALEDDRQRKLLCTKMMKSQKEAFVPVTRERKTFTMTIPDLIEEDDKESIISETTQESKILTSNMSKSTKETFVPVKIEKKTFAMNIPDLADEAPEPVTAPAPAPAPVAVKETVGNRMRRVMSTLKSQPSFMVDKHEVHATGDIAIPELAQEHEFKAFDRKVSHFDMGSTTKTTVITKVEETAEEVAQRKALLAQQEAQLKEDNKVMFEQQRREAEEKRVKEREALRLRAMERAKSRFAAKDKDKDSSATAAGSASAKGLARGMSSFRMNDVISQAMSAANSAVAASNVTVALAEQHNQSVALASARTSAMTTTTTTTNADAQRNVIVNNTVNNQHVERRRAVATVNGTVTTSEEDEQSTTETQHSTESHSEQQHLGSTVTSSVRQVAASGGLLLEHIAEGEEEDGEESD